MSQIIATVSGSGVPVPGDDIDTDRIIPARFLKCVTFDGLGEHAFSDDRAQAFAAGGDPHAFDDPKFRNGKILIVGKNFGCGSSREHAPQALYRWGIRAVVGVDFAEIFFGNSVAIGMPCVRVSADVAAELSQLVSQQPDLELSVDLAQAQLQAGDQQLDVGLPDGAQQAFLSGAGDATGGLLANLERTRATAAALPYMRNFAPN